jgi:hypothetical protein
MENFDFGAIAQIASYVVLAASVVANFTKTETDNIWIARISKVVNFFALNLKKK